MRSCPLRSLILVSALFIVALSMSVLATISEAQVQHPTVNIEELAKGAAYEGFTVGDLLDLDFDKQYSHLFLLRRAMRLGIHWAQFRGLERNLALQKGDEDSSCMLHKSTGTILNEIKRLADANKAARGLGLYTAFSLVVTASCKKYDDWWQKLFYSSL